MIKHTLKRAAALLLALLMVITVLPNVAWAANVETGVPGLTAESSGSATWESSGTTITGSVTASSSSGCTGTTYTAQSGTLTFTNSSGAVALLSFNYSLTLNGGSATVDGADVTAGAAFSKKLEAGETVVVSITSPGAEETTYITINNLKLTPEMNIDLTFKVPTNGSYTVDGTAITADTVQTVKTTDSVALSAAAASGYKFFGWYSETTGAYFSTAASITTSFTEPQTIEPQFVSNSTPVFQVGVKLFTDLNEAVSYAQSSGTTKIALVSDGTLPAGDYTIPSGKTLVIPFDEAQTIYTATPGMTLGSDGKPAAHVAPSAFRTLTMAGGAKITVASGGTLSVPSMLSAVGTNSGSWNATPTGKHGRITMNSDSSIDVQSGGKLFVYGYISGSGNVYARSGAEIWECFQIRCWRGGTATSSMADNSQKVFPLNQYYVQNIEAPLTLYAGATEKVFAAVNASSQQFGASATFVGNGGMFQISSGSVTKRFTGASDRLELSVDGSFAVSSMSLKITGLPLIGTLDLNTEDYVLPIQSNITLNINSGTTTLSQDVAFLPGAQMNIASGANVTLSGNHKAYVYDKDQWGAYAASGQQLVVVGYSTVNGTTAKRSASSLVDAKIDVNGTLNVAGQLYTTESGAAIVSSGGTGKVVQTAAPGTETNTYMATQSSSDMTYVSIPITAAKLQNANGTYVETANKPAGTVIPYISGFWGGEPKTIQVFFYANEGEGTMDPQDFTQNVPQNLKPNTFTRTGYDFVGWNTAADGSGDAYGDGAEVSFDSTEDVILYAQWEIQKFTVTWKNEDGTVLETDENVPYGTAPTYDSETPTKEGNAQYSYTFDGWTGEGEDTVYTADTLPAVEADASYSAHFAETVNTYTVTWKNEDGTVLETDENVPYGDTPVYDGQTPEKEATAQYTYTFAGWADENGTVVEELPAVTGDAVYTATYEQTLNQYTVTWVIDGQTETETYDYGAVPAHADPTKEADAEYTYTFTGWADESGTVLAELPNVTGEVTYTAVFEATRNTYIITWIVDGQTTTETYEYGQTPVYKLNGEPADPVKEGDAQYTYTFTGWDPAIASVTGPATYTAQFEQTVNTYSVTWKNWDGGVLTVEEYEYGQTPVYPNPDPERTSDEASDYAFAGWEPEIVPVTGPATYTASFTATPRMYEIQWVVEGQETLVTYWPYGSTPEYQIDGEPAVPTKAEDEQYTYAFSHWEPEIAPVTEDTFYIARFTPTIKTYQITWKVDGQADVTETYPYGEIPVYKINGEPADPVKEGDAQYTYTFAGWDPAIEQVTGNATYTARFNQTVNVYTVTWMVDGMEALEDYEYGATPVYKIDGEPADPVKEGSAQYTYTFAGWDPEITEVTGPATYTAIFNETVNTYTVTWQNEDGTVLETDENVPYGETPVYDGQTPEKEATAQYTYTFAGWDPVPSAITGDTTYTAVYQSTLRQYNVTFVDEDEINILLEAALYDYGTPFSQLIKPEEPTKPATDEHEYTFLCWQYQDGDQWKDVAEDTFTVNGDLIFKPKFTESVRSYEINWLDEDGTPLRTDTLEYGEMPDYGDTSALVKPADAQYSYTFAGWTPEIVPVTGPAIYTAVYDKTVNTYTITWNNDDGTLIDTTIVPYGETPVHDDAYKPADAQYTYTFVGWSPEPVPVTGEAIYTAVYETTLRTYTVTWKNEDGTVLETDENVPYGTVPTYDGQIPTKEGDDQFSYTFEKWSPDVTAVVGDAVYTAVFTVDTNAYTVTWKNDDGTLLELDENVLYGATPSYDGETPVKTATAQYTYTFSGWVPEIAPVTGNVTYTAVYKQTLRTYTVTWKNEDGTVLETDENVPYSTVPTYDGETPTKEGSTQYSYSFAGWTPDVHAVEGDQVYTAKFTETVNTYTVIWKDADGTVLETDLNVPYGETPTYDSPAPAKDQTNTTIYTFAGWTPDIRPVDGDQVYTAVYDEAVRKYTVTWLNYNGDELQKTEVEYEAPVPEYRFTGDQGEDLTPTRPASAQFHYNFLGFDPEVKEGDKVTADMTFTAQFEEVVNTYTVTWIAGDVTYTDEVAYGETPVYDHDTPAKASTVSTDYTFIGWDHEITMVTGEQTYTALFSESVRSYTITWLDRNGEQIASEPVPYGSLPTAPAVPDVSVHTGDEEGVYKFHSWNKEITEVTGDESYQALYRFTGLRIDEGGKRYLVDDEAQYGWAEVNGETYYFDYADGYAATGVAGTEKRQDADREAGWYVFDENGVFQADQNGVYHDGSDIYWTENGRVVEYAGLVRVVLDNGEVNYYYFGEDNKAVKNGTFKAEKNNDLPLPAFNYDFDANGVIVHDADTSKNGICAPTEDDGKLYYMIDGVRVGMGLLRIDGSYYYARTSTAEIVRGRSYWVSVTNGLPIAEGMYRFDDDGRMLINGFVSEGDKTVYYVDGVMAKGFTKIEDAYYFFNLSSGRMYKNAKLWVGENEYGVTPNMYNFGDDGKMETSGFVESGGYTYYYRDLELVKGFTKIDEDYYFFNAGSGKMYKDITLWVGENEYGFQAGMYYFGADGKMVIPDLENGRREIVEVNGKLYFTIDGMRQTGGLYELDGEYYYAQSNGELVVGNTVYVSHKNGLIPEKGNYYAFDDQGRLIKTGFVNGSDGYTYYYDNMVLALGLTKIGGDYYFFNAGSGKLYRDKNLWVGANDYGIEPGMHYFDADGKLNDN